MSKAVDNFLKYVSIDTQSQEEAASVPSTEKQRNLAKVLVDQLRSMGAEDARADEHCYVYATIPATSEKKVPALGFISHMDTSPACSGSDIRPRIIPHYDGTVILLNEEKQIRMTPEEFPDLLDCVGDDLIVTDGTTLLGADDKAGVAEIMAMAEHLLTHPDIPHGTIRIAFTPDEEVGRGTDFFDIQGFGADVAYTVDGGGLGELEYENFNAASAKVAIHGFSIHTGTAKGRMKHALLMGMEFHSMLPAFENPMYTEGYEGFYHLDAMEGTVEEAHMNYLIRDHDRNRFEEKKRFLGEIAGYLNRKYGEGTVELSIRDSYFNMKEKIEPHAYLVSIAREAMEELGIPPLVRPIRGGTDGARLSFRGLPCPNLCTGGYQFHGRYEFLSVQAMEKTVELLVRIVKKFEER